MTAAQYFLNLVYQQTVGLMPPYAAVAHFNPLLNKWAAGHLLETKVSGSFAKGTAVKICADVDIFISISPSLNMTLAEIYDSLFKFFNDLSGYKPRKQNVSIRLNLGSSATVDLVPGKKQGNYTGDHSLYVKKRNTWMQTNVDTHISAVRSANRADVIKLTKIWRERHRLDFPSFYLELAVIRALGNNNYGDLEEQFRNVLVWLDQNITSARFVDPANTNNVISDDLTASEKLAIAYQAKQWQRVSNWGQVVW